MSNLELVRAWKDPDFRSTLNFVPTHPAGQIEFSDPELDQNAAQGGPRRFLMAHTKNASCSHTFNTKKHCGC